MSTAAPAAETIEARSAVVRRKILEGLNRIGRPFSVGTPHERRFNSVWLAYVTGAVELVELRDAFQAWAKEEFEERRLF